MAAPDPAVSATATLMRWMNSLALAAMAMRAGVTPCQAASWRVRAV